MPLTDKQIQFLLKPVNPGRVQQRGQAGRSFSYLSQHDVRAHAIRVFGFGNFDLRTLRTDVLYCEQDDRQRWSAGVSVTMEVTIRDPDGNHLCVYSETAVGSATLPSKGEALDMATKTGSSDAFKRCMINLGDAFGLSLYEDGSTDAYVRGTLVNPKPQAAESTSDETPEATPAADAANPQGSPSEDPDTESLLAAATAHIGPANPNPVRTPSDAPGPSGPFKGTQTRLRPRSASQAI